MIKIKMMKMYKEVELPKYQTKGSVGADVRAFLPEGKQKVSPGETVVIPTGIKMEVPPGYECQVRPRGGTALRGIQVANSPGTVDSDYRGEVGILVYNANEYPIFIKHTERIAQLVFKEVPRVWIEEVSELSDTDRGEGAYNSTGRF